jgi:hypothetical protein
MCTVTSTLITHGVGGSSTCEFHQVGDLILRNSDTTGTNQGWRCCYVEGEVHKVGDDVFSYWV